MPILLLLYGVIPAVQVAFYLTGRPVAGIGEALNYAASIFAFHWLAANVAVSAKIPRSQHIIPYDARIRFHIFASAGIIVSLIYHAAYKNLSGTYIGPLNEAPGAVLGLMLVVAVLWIPVPGLTAARSKILSAARKGAAFHYDRAKAVHGYFVLALGLVLLVHLAVAGLFEEVPPVSVALYLLVFLLSFGLYALGKFGAFDSKATVSEVEEHRGITTIRLRTDKAHSFKAGQFAFLRARGPAKTTEEHPFSYLSTPDEANVSFAVRGCGDFTNHLATLKPGDRVKIKGGFGDFHPGKEPALCFISSGIGTVPFISILKALYKSGEKRPLRFFMSVNYEDEIPELDRIKEIAASMPNLDLRVLVYSVDGLRYSEEFFRRELPDPTKYVHYVCSSPKVRTSVIKSLNALGVKKSAIRFEEFSLG